MFVSLIMHGSTYVQGILVLAMPSDGLSLGLEKKIAFGCFVMYMNIRRADYLLTPWKMKGIYLKLKLLCPRTDL